MRWLLVVFLFSVSGASLAIECNREGGQLELNQCAYDDFAKADKQLNNVWQQLVTKAGDDKYYIDKLRAAQRAWISFRDAELAAMFACESENQRYCWGSMYPMSYNYAKLDLTVQRTKRLQEYLRDGQNPESGEGQ